MIRFLRKLSQDKRGNALIIAAAALPLLLGSAGLATDTIQWALWKRQLREYEAPPIDPALDEALKAFIASRKAVLPDAVA